MRQLYAFNHWTRDVKNTITNWCCDGRYANLPQPVSSVGVGGELEWEQAAYSGQHRRSFTYSPHTLARSSLSQQPDTDR